MVTLVLGHGIGAQDDQLQWYSAARAKWLPMRGVSWAPYYWEDLRNPPTEKDLKDGRTFGWSQWGALSAFSDLITYGNVRYLAFKRLEALIDEIEGDVVLVFHSLGSVLAYQFLALLKEQPQVKGLITLGSPIGRQPVCGKIKKTLRVPWWKSLPGLGEATPWVNITGGSDLVTSWFGGGIISEADTNMVVPFAGHDLTAYIGSKEFRQAVRGLVNQCG
ncbi:hypothetical protein UFOVP380_8 [uncultured Caudovirales phage]|uniref:Alpha/beta hydrolase n=1 Tax=uncultured Caudovirales phage TaxID=2100421 RepID=A0A6J7X2E1_9CAUD|nr:hypothetical protein UFOVP380_8 [uncultured Caudovirales phage]